MAIENAKMLNVRIKNKYDSYENWAASGLVLEAGEIAIAHTTVDVQVGNGTAKHPALLMKVGNGTDTFANLPWLSAKAADVLAVCKDETELRAFINGVITDAGVATDDALKTLSTQVTTNKGNIEALQTAVGDADKGLVKAVAVLESLVGGTEVSTQIQTYVNNLNLATTYAAKSIETTVSDHIADTVAHVTTADKTKWNGALQASDIAAGSANGTIAVKGTDVAITGLGSAAFTESSAYDAAGAASAAEAAAKAYADGLAGNYDAKGAASAAETAAKSYADGLAKNYDAVGSAAQALTDAKTYVDGFTGGKTVSDSISDTIKNYSTTEQMNTAIATAKGEAVTHANGLNTAMDARVAALELIDHTHSNLEALEGINAAKIDAWSAAEENAKKYANNLDMNMNQRVEALEAKFGDGEGNVEAQIAAAVAGEAALRESADAGLQAQIGTASEEGKAATGLHARIEELESLVGDDKVSDAIEAAVKVERERAQGIEEDLEIRLAEVEADFLTSADKEALQTQINTIMSNPDAEGAINSINEFTQYINDHKPVAEAFRTDINKNAADIAAEVKRAGEAEAELQGTINGIAADLESLEGVVAKAADLTDLAGRVTTVEGKVTALEGEMDDAQAAIEALEGLTGGKKVSDAINEAIEALKIGDYAKAADLTAAITQHNTDKAALEAEIAKKANDASLAAIAKTGSTDDLVQGTMTLVFDCGGSGV